MKKLIHKLLIGNAIFKEFPAISIDENAINEKVFIEIDNTKIEVSKSHWLLSLEPMVFGVWLSKDNPTIDKKTKCTLYFNSKRNETVAVLRLIFTNSIKENEGKLYLFEVKKSSLFYFNLFKIWLIYEIYYRKPKQSFLQFKNLVTAFSYPRKVRLVSFKQDKYINLFPMDLIGDIPDNNRFVFGLRHFNATLGKIIEEKKIVVIEFPYFLKDVIYKLSDHHSSNSVNIDELPFKAVSSELFGFPVPEWTINYKEIKIKKTLNLGSHMLLWGESMNDFVVNENENSLFHIHFVNYLYQKDTNFEYNLV